MYIITYIYILNHRHLNISSSTVDCCICDRRKFISCRDVKHQKIYNIEISIYNVKKWIENEMNNTWSKSFYLINRIKGSKYHRTGFKACALSLFTWNQNRVGGRGTFPLPFAAERGGGAVQNLWTRFCGSTLIN